MKPPLLCRERPRAAQVVRACFTLRALPVRVPLPGMAAVYAVMGATLGACGQLWRR